MALELAQAGLSVVNPSAAGLISAARYATQRSGVLGGGRTLSETLGKDLSHHQVIHAVNQTRTANNPRLDFGKAVLSRTGGNPRMVNQSQTPNSRTTLQISPHDAKAVLRDNFSNHLKFTPAHKSLISY